MGAAGLLPASSVLETLEHADGFLWQGPATPPEGFCWLQKLGAWSKW